MADLTTSLLAALGVPEPVNPLGLAAVERACLLLVDGLGSDLLAAHPTEAPFMNGLLKDAQQLTTGFPSTTAVSVGMLGAGTTPGRTGLVGFTISVPDFDRAMNVLRWSLHGPGPHVDLREELPPERFQPAPTVFERAHEQGIETYALGAFEFRTSGLTRAALRGAEYRGTTGLGDLAATAADLLRRPGRRLVYGYDPDLDMTGHLRGPDSEAWRLQLRHVDRLVEDIANALPGDALLAVTGDHGMVGVPEESRIDLDDPRERRLLENVRLVAGEPRARHVYARNGSADEVAAAWRERLAEQAWVLTKEEAIAADLFGPVVTDDARGRIGDVVVAARSSLGIFQPSVSSLEARLIGHHGSLTDAERLVPLLLVKR